jgi:GntR family transcriptional regulator, phosphonate transport system regulatory protein
LGRESWRRIRDGLAAEIDGGGLPPGAQLPTESALCAQFETGRHSVRRAVQALAIEGRLRVVQGRGTFVEAARVVRYAIGRRTRFRQNLLDQGLTPSGEPLSAETVPAPVSIAEALGIASGDPVHRLVRRGLADGVPVSLGLSWHPARQLPDFLEQRNAGLSVTDAYAAHGIDDYYRKRTEIFARRPDREEARLLAQHPDLPVMVVVKTDVTQDGRLIGHSEAIWAADRVRFTIDSLEAGDV